MIANICITYELSYSLYEHQDTVDGRSLINMNVTNDLETVFHKLVPCVSCKLLQRERNNCNMIKFSHHLGMHCNSVQFLPLGLAWGIIDQV